nr:NADH dehydrogenase [ubiquinone] 1 alpha subcomplex subunit 10, mitochondrial [Megalopta genalis]
MASIFRVNFLKVNPARCLNRLCKVSKNYNVVQVASMTRIANMKHVNKPPPYPYWKKHYRPVLDSLDPMIYRFDENTRIVVVDGPPAVGKTKVCEKIAADFGMLYMPQPTHDQIYVYRDGFDRRTLDPQLPPHIQSYDISKFLKNPTDKRAALFQVQFFWMRHSQYMNAILHLVSTGQGVVLNRCFFSELAFAITMKQAGYMSPMAFAHYEMLTFVASCFFPRPHITIYLDVPVQDVQEKIKRRDRSGEANSKVFSTQFLTNLENAYKEKYLKPLSNHTYILAYDWSKEGDLNTITSDIENLDIDDETSTMTKDWYFCSVSNLKRLRVGVCRERDKMYYDMMAQAEKYVAPELLQSAEEEEIEQNVWKSHPGLRYAYGYSPKDKPFFKHYLGPPDRELFRNSEQDFINRGY